MSLYKRPDSPYHYMRFVVAGTAVNRSTGTEDRDAAQEVEDRERALLHRQQKLRDGGTLKFGEVAQRWMKTTKRKADQSGMRHGH